MGGTKRKGGEKERERWGREREGTLAHTRIDTHSHIHRLRHTGSQHTHAAPAAAWALSNSGLQLTRSGRKKAQGRLVAKKGENSTQKHMPTLVACQC